MSALSFRGEYPCISSARKYFRIRLLSFGPQPVKPLPYIWGGGSFSRHDCFLLGAESHREEAPGSGGSSLPAARSRSAPRTCWWPRAEMRGAGRSVLGKLLVYFTLSSRYLQAM